MRDIVRAGATALLFTACLTGGAATAEEGVAMKNLLGDMGIIPKDKDPIRYRERAPLVLPPKMDLREPTAASASAGGEQWPNDPDVVARKARIEAGRRPVTESEIRRMADRNPTLSVEEMRTGRNPNAQVATVPGTHRGDNAHDVLYANTATASAASSDSASVSAAPVRRTLSDPPTAFRKSATGGTVSSDWTPKIDQQERDANPINWLTSKFKRSSDDD